jgi:hypothetical protein
MSQKSAPHDSIKYFFQSLVQNQCQVAWDLFSPASQKHFVNWTMQDIYTQNEKAAKAAKLGYPEVKLMFETNNLDLVLRFWRRFVQQSRAAEFARFAYFDTLSQNGGKATVEAKIVYPNGQELKRNLITVFDRSKWRFGYIESDLPF